MLLDSGVATIWRGRDTALSGSKPNIVYDQEVFSSYYGNKTVGINRYWAAQANNNQADLLIQIQRKSGILATDRCQLSPALDDADAGCYKIIQVQQVLDEDEQPATELTLGRIEGLETP